MIDRRIRIMLVWYHALEFKEVVMTRIKPFLKHGPTIGLVLLLAVLVSLLAQAPSRAQSNLTLVLTHATATRLVNGQWLVHIKVDSGHPITVVSPLEDSASDTNLELYDLEVQARVDQAINEFLVEYPSHLITTIRERPTRPVGGALLGGVIPVPRYVTVVMTPAGSG